MSPSLLPFAATAIIQLANLAGGILAARYLLPEGRGELAAVLLLPSLLAALGGLSIGAGAGYYAAREPNRTATVFASSTALAAVLSVILVLVGLVLVPFAYGDRPHEVVALTRIYLAFIPFNLLGLCSLAILQGRREDLTFNALRGLMPVAYVAFILVAVVLHRSTVAGFTVAFLAGSIVVTVLAAAMLIAKGWAAWHPVADLTRAIAGYGLRVHMGVVVGIAIQRIDQLLIALWLDPAALGFYAVALAAASVVGLLGSTMDIVVFPRIAGAADDAARAATLGTCMRMTTVLSLVAVVILVPLLPWLISLLYGAAFAPAVPAAQLLAIASLPLAVKTVAAAALRGAGQPMAASRIEVFVFLALAVALVVLLPPYGIRGAAWSVLVAQSIGGVLAVRAAGRTLGLRWGEMLMPRSDDLRRMVQLLRPGRR